MKYSQPYDAAKQKWDRYGHFYVPHNDREWNGFPFVRFITGELAIVGGYFRPSIRGVYPAYNVAVALSSDPAYNYFTPAGVAIPKAQLTAQGYSPLLLIDLDTKRAVRANWGGVAEKDKLPFHLRQVLAWIPAEGANPCSVLPIEVSPPTEFPKEVLEWKKEIRVLAQARVALAGIERPRYGLETIKLDCGAFGKTLDQLVNASYHPERRMYALAHGRIQLPRDVETYDHLLIERP